MRAGLLWFDDNEHKPLKTKVAEAVAAYRAKPRFQGKEPDICYIHPSMLSGGQETHIDGVRVAAADTVALHNFLVGVEKRGGNERKRRRKGRKRSGRRKS